MAFDEMRDGELARATYAEITAWVERTPLDQLQQKSAEAELLFRRLGITFAVYGEGGDPERLIPFDIIPRIIAASEWRALAAGLEPRVRALNAFLADIYNEQRILTAGIVPKALILENEAFEKQMVGFTPPGGIYTHISGIDMVRTGPDDFFVLEDNCRTPSGVSYMLENREAMLRLFPRLCARHRLAPVNRYPEHLLATLKSVAPVGAGPDPTVVILTPGSFNSAYYEHCFLADEMGVEVVEGRDLTVENDRVLMRTTAGLKQVDVIYRRIDDDFLDPECFRADSLVGVPGVMRAYKAGHVTLANAPGAGIADDKAIYPYVPNMVRFYLDEEPMLANVPTWLCEREEDRALVLSRLEELVVKLARGSGGYGMMVGPHADAATRAEFARRIAEKPGDYIAQPTLALSTVPTVAADGISPRHVDLRPFILFGQQEITIVPGGLTRVALRPGSLVVNSSQGGGTKDTWVLEDAPVMAQSMEPGMMTQTMGGMTQVLGGNR